MYVSVPVVDEAGYLRVDDWEMRPDVQQEIDRIWPIVSTDNANEYCDIEGYWDDFFQMFGFRQPGIDYASDVDINLAIPSIPVEDEAAG